MFDSAQLDLQRRQMLDLLAERGIASPRVLEAMGRVPRERFVPKGVQHLAYSDRALPIACDQTISQPYIVALMTEALQLRGHERVLDVGTGCGYQAAVLAELAAEVITIERHAPLSHEAQRLLDELGYTNVRCVVGDGTHGWPAGAPYDGILVAAAAAHVPSALKEQLADKGRLVIPVGPADGQDLEVYVKLNGRLYAESLGGCRFVPLIGAQDGISGAGSDE